MFGASRRISYNQQAEGIWGEFCTPAGRIQFLTTKARLASNTPDLESRLTGLLSPVREVLDVAKLNFNQLLQRDLDDHRVATELLPYIIRPTPTGPAFFPPIVAALLPFRGNQAADEFPPFSHHPREHVAAFGEQAFEECRYGDAYRFQRMTADDGTPHPVRFGRLEWNQESAKLVVLDGQHRAMALLAIERTLSGTWGSSTGSKYRHFYEHRVEALLEEARAEYGEKIDLSQVEYPVTLVWFPDYDGPTRNPHVAARKLFVDVNKNARQPSEARLVLLSDTELLNIFTRTALNRLRENAAPFPLYVVEYDNPEKESSRPVRWSVFTNITMLRSMIEKAMFGPPKYIENVSLTFGGRVSAGEMDRHMQKQLSVRDLFPSEIEEGEERTIKRSALGNENFPQYNKEAQSELLSRFMERWGSGILHILGEFLPFKRRIEAVRELKSHWTHDDSVASLAYDAMFEGVGMYWTLRSSNSYWREKMAEGTLADKDKPEIVKAWDAIERKGSDFVVLRAKHLLGSTGDDAKRQSEFLYSAVNTYACQVGMVMTLATLAHFHPAQSPAEVAAVLVRSWNASLLGTPGGSRNRLLLLSREVKKPPNMIPKMDSPHAIYFRYFFLQLLEAEEACVEWSGILDADRLRELTGAARWAYYAFLIQEKAKAYKRTQPSWSSDKRAKHAESDVRKELGAALNSWFNIGKADFETWAETLGAAGDALAGSENADGSSTPDAEADAESTPESLDEIAELERLLK